MNSEKYLKDAFSRNIGLLDEKQQQILLKSRVAVAGAGGGIRPGSRPRSSSAISVSVGVCSPTVTVACSVA